MDKITALKKAPEDTFGTQRVTFLYWYVLNPRIQDSRGNDIVVIRASDLPEAGVVYVDSIDSNALNMGDAGFETMTRDRTAGETNVAFLARILADHSAREILWIQAQRNVWVLAGTGRSV